MAKGLSNLPPGCSSPDGGIDHVYEAAVEALLKLLPTVEEVRVAVNVLPAIFKQYRKIGADSYNEGYDNGCRSAYANWHDNNIGDGAGR